MTRTIAECLEEMVKRVEEARNAIDYCNATGDKYNAAEWRGKFAAHLSDLKLMVEMVARAKNEACKKCCVFCEDEEGQRECVFYEVSNEYSTALLVRAEGKK